MKRLVLATLLLFAFATPHADAGKKLPASATFKLKVKIANRAQVDGLGNPTFACSRLSPTKIRCGATATKKTDLATTECTYVGDATNRKVVKRKRGRKVIRWVAKYKVSRGACDETLKPPSAPSLRLEESDAKKAVGKAGQEQLGHGVRIESFRRDGETIFLGWVSWSELLNPGNILGPSLYCEADIRVEMVAVDDIRVEFIEPACGFSP